jgi:hypothetical protein
MESSLLRLSHLVVPIAAHYDTAEIENHLTWGSLHHIQQNNGKAIT